MINTILVPVDFSESAANALTIACEFNKKFKAKILIYYSYFIPVPVADMPAIVATPAEMKKVTMDSLMELKEKYCRLYPGMEFSIEMGNGFVEDEIVEAVKKIKCDLVVMGTYGAKGAFEMLVGTNTSGVIEKSICPVMVVPEKATINGLHKIVFATNYGSDDFRNVFDTIDIARMFDSEIVLLHIRTGEMDKTMEFEEIEGFQQQVARETKYPKLKFKLIEDESVYHGLNEYLEESKANMLVISMRNRTFFQKIFSRSLTKKLASHSSIPVLAFHTDI